MFFLFLKYPAICEKNLNKIATKKLQINKCPWKYHIYFYFFFSPIISEALLNRAHLNQCIFPSFQISSAHRKVPNYSISIFLKIIFLVNPYNFSLWSFCVVAYHSAKCSQCSQMLTIIVWKVKLSSRFVDNLNSNRIPKFIR